MKKKLASVSRAHRVKMHMPSREVGNAETIFEAWKGKTRIGCLCVSKGGVKWWPSDAKKSRNLTWWRLGQRIMAEP